MTPISFRSSRIVYYGPHTCENCGTTICKMGWEWGGNAFTYPDGWIYPNTEWHPHVCDPDLVRKRKGMAAGSVVTSEWPNAHVVLLNDVGHVVLGERYNSQSQKELYLVITPNLTFYDTEDAAWMGALERIEQNLPTWHIDLSRYGVHAIERSEPPKPYDGPITASSSTIIK